MSEQQNPAPEAGDDAVVPEGTPEAEAQEVETEGQVETPPAEEGEEPDPDKKSRSQQRRERQKAHLKELEAQAKNATDRLERIKQAAAGEKEPVKDDFDDPDEYIAAKAAWRGAQSVTQREEQNLSAEVESLSERQKAEAQALWQAQVEDARAKYSDFDAVALNPTNPVSDTMADIIRSSDTGPDLAYYLGQNRAEAARISQMSPLEAAMAMGRLEATMSAPKPQVSSKAPPPIQPVKGSTPASRNPESMSMAEYVAARKAGKL